MASQLGLLTTLTLHANYVPQASGLHANYVPQASGLNLVPAHANLAQLESIVVF